ncbi:MAG: hypothetical protein JNL67_20725 [Planctomycetaceae bacterium]|nr:hypothetical protein [Planctomycetaceae bacterium]
MNIRTNPRLDRLRPTNNSTPNNRWESSVRLREILSLGSFLIAMTFAGNLYGQNVVEWINPNGGEWQDAANWDSGSVPMGMHDAKFALPDTYSITGSQMFPVHAIEVRNGAVSFQMPSVNTTNFLASGAQSVNFGTATGQNPGTVNISSSFYSSLAKTFVGSNTTVSVGETRLDNGSALNILGAQSLWRTASLDSAFSSLHVENGQLEVGNVAAGAYTLMIANSASLAGVFVEDTELYNSGSANIGGTLNSHSGQIELSDSSIWLNTGAIHIGHGGSGAMFIRGGSQVESGGTTTLVGKTGGIGEMTSGYFKIDGTGSQWEMSGDLAMAHSLAEVTNGGSLTTIDAELFRSELTVSGVNSNWSNNNLVVGHDSLLTISNGGRVESYQANIDSSTPDTLVGVHVTGHNSRWQISNLLSFGWNSGGKLLIEDGGTVSVGTLVLNSIDSSIVVGIGSELRVSQNTYLGAFSTLTVDGGYFDFGTTSLDEYRQIVKNGGWLAGDVDVPGSRNTLGALAEDFRSTWIDVSDVRIKNHGLLIGSGEVDSGLHNTVNGHVRLSSTDQMLFNGTDNFNQGRISNLGGTLEFLGMVNNGGQIAGRGTFSAETWLNSGTIAINGQSDIFGEVYNGDSLGFDGALIVTSANATTTFYDKVINNGEIRTSGDGNTVFFGDYYGAGSFTGTGNVFFEGGVNPGNSPASVIMEGNLTLGVDSHTLIELGGLNSGEFDQFKIAGDFNILGSLSVDLWNNFELGSNRSFLIADIGGTRFGMFEGLGEGALVGRFSGHDLFITYNAGNGNDIALFSAVPEPSALVLCLVPMLGLATARRRRV